MSKNEEIQEFNWAKEFPKACDKNGDFEGFDVVIGNPPYISIKKIPKNHKEYFTQNFQTAKGQFDLYTLFIEKSKELLKQNGHFSMITSNTYFTNKSLKPIRKFLLDNMQILQLVNLGESIFKEAKLDVGITTYRKQKMIDEYEINIVPNKRYFDNKQSYWLSKNNFETSENNIYTINISPFESQLFNKIKINTISLSEIANINRGIEFGSNSEKIKSQQEKNTYPIIVGHSIEKYRIKNFEGYTKFNDKNKSNYKDFNLYSNPRILVQRIRNLSIKTRLVATYTEEIILCTNTLRIITLLDDTFDYRYVLGLLNSRLINYFFLKNFLNKDIYAYQLGLIPVKSADKKWQKKIQEIVVEIEKSQNKNDLIKLQNKIDKIVYKLYGLNRLEIAKIEKFYEQKFLIQ